MRPWPEIRDPAQLARSFHARAARCRKLADEEGEAVLKDELRQLADFLDERANTFAQMSPHENAGNWPREWKTVGSSATWSRPQRLLRRKRLSPRPASDAVLHTSDLLHPGRWTARSLKP